MLTAGGGDAEEFIVSGEVPWNTERDVEKSHTKWSEEQVDIMTAKGKCWCIRARGHCRYRKLRLLPSAEQQDRLAESKAHGGQRQDQNIFT